MRAARLESRDEREREDDARSCDEREINRKIDERTNEKEGERWKERTAQNE